MALLGAPAAGQRGVSTELACCHNAAMHRARERLDNGRGAKGEAHVDPLAGVATRGSEPAVDAVWAVRRWCCRCRCRKCGAGLAQRLAAALQKESGSHTGFSSGCLSGRLATAKMRIAG